ncbi:MAG: squalene--hopene cyclase [Proteobacteria bacterium]|nr:squalene--hopene cyclase [Pseudomonadota bacterium]
MTIEAQQPGTSALDATLDHAIANGIGWSLSQQHEDGYWVGKLQSNSCMEAQWILAFHVMGLHNHPQRAGLIRSLVHEQREDGSWAIYHGAAAGDINTTVECYAALRCVGYAANDPILTKARGWIMQRGGLTHIRVFTRYWLALIGEWPWKHAPNIPAEVVRFPKWFPFNIYNFASWARATLMPIAVLSTRRITVPLPEKARLDELFPEGRVKFDYSLPKKSGFFLLERFFLTTDKILHAIQSANLMPGRENAVARIVEWIVRHQDADGAWGGIQPPWVYSLMALQNEGYPLTHPVMAKALAALEDPRWAYEKNGATYIQASVSPVWDTVLTLLAMEECEVQETNAAAVDRAVSWLLDNEVRTKGDWAQKVKNVEPGGWAFEYANANYPDVDDTAVAIMVLAKHRDNPKWQKRDIDGVLNRALNWVIAMQCRDGGWAAFDRDNDKQILCKIPFCDFGEALDPPSVDVTAHVLEACGALGHDRTHPVVARAIDWLKSEQEADGSWWGRWGVNYVYGTAAVLPALKAVGEDMREDYVQRAADWTLQAQGSDGGWGESCGSYMDASLAGKGASTASQTGWGLMSLLAVGRTEDRQAVERGLTFLTKGQAEGTWDEPEFTGTGFPGYGLGRHVDLGDKKLEHNLGQSIELSRGFMINYNLYRHYFPLMAMGRARPYLKRVGNEGSVSR